jgi:long-chain acyl-CoA synthetase
MIAQHPSTSDVTTPPLSTHNAAFPLFEHTRKRPAATAVRVPAHDWSYAALSEAVDDLRTLLRDHGVAAGDRVLIVCPTGPAFVAGYLAVLANGGVAVTINPQCTQRELSYFIHDSGARLCLAGGTAVATTREAAAASSISVVPLSDPPASEPRVSASVQHSKDCDGGIDIIGDEPANPPDATTGSSDCAAVSPSSPAVLLYTSGTTGHPKGAVLTHANLSAAAGIYVDLLAIDANDRLGTALPLFHVFGQVAVLLTALHAGAPVSLLAPFSGQGLLSMSARHRLTILTGVPTMWTEMLHAEDEAADNALSSLRLACSGGAALPRALQQAFRNRFGATVLDGYGLSESTSAASFNYPGREVKEGSVGQALPGVELVIVDDNGQELPSGQPGEITLGGPTIMSRYWDRPTETAEAITNGRLHTGDVGQLDEDGYVWILDRKKDMIIRGGYNVYPREIEELLLHHPAVREVAIIGIPDERLGEEIAAVIVLDHHAGSVTPAQLREWLTDRLAAYKHPRLYQVVDALPKGSTGKLVKRQIDRATVRREASRASRTI